MYLSKALVPTKPKKKLAQIQQSAASKFRLQATGLGTYLFYDENKQYLASGEKKLIAVSALTSEMKLAMSERDYLITPAEWKLQSAPGDLGAFIIKNLSNDLWIADGNLSADVNSATAFF